MRAIILADFAAPSGGAQRVALESARALAEAGVPVTYVHAVGRDGDPPLEHPLIEPVGLGFADVWDLPLTKALGNGVWNAQAARRLKALLAGIAGPAVIHIHQWTRAFSPAILPVCFASGHPVAITLHDYFLACPNGVYYRFDKNAPCTVAPLSLGCLVAPCDPRSRAHKAVRVLRTALTGQVLRGRDVDLIHVSDRGRDTIAPFLPQGVRHHRIDNPVAVVRREPATIGPGAKFAYIGRLTREKGADLLALAAREAGVPALFIGEGPLADEIRRLNPQAELLGWQSPDAVARLLGGQVRAVVAPSRWYETGPLTVYEAAAAGVPTIVSARAGAAEHVSRSETGLIVEPEPAALAQALRCLGEGDAAARMGAAAYRRYWSAPMSPEAHASRLIAVYGTMLGAAEASAPVPQARPAFIPSH